jgi:hypothetical protein
MFCPDRRASIDDVRKHSQSIWVTSINWPTMENVPKERIKEYI